jgi:tetratricopeptide (TPR) repeat protein
MDAVTDLFGNTVFQIVVGGIAAAALVVFVLRRRRLADPAASSPAGTAAAAGNFEKAANLELRAGNLSAALEYFLRAQMPLRAASLAQRLQRHRQAGELFEMGGDVESAAAMYKAAGLGRKAEELLAAHRKRKAPGAAPKDDPGESRDSGPLTPLEQVAKAERKLARIKERAARGEAGAAAEAETAARELSESLLSAGDIRKAAQVCEENGLVDQAINLYVNLLGDVGAAASLFSNRGDHKRAAELFEAAGKKERALAAWLEWSKDAPDPLAHLSEVARLGETPLHALLEAVVEARPLADATMDLHYRVADAYAKHNKPASAVGILEKVIRIAPQYRDAGARLKDLRGALARAAQEPPRPAADTVALGPAPALELVPEERAEDITRAPTLLQPGTQAPPGREAPRRPSPAPTAREDALELERLADSPALERLVSEVAAAAARQATNIVWGGGGEPSRQPRKQVLTRGIERVEVSLNLMQDSAVADARRGPSTDEIVSLIGGRAPDLQNVELYYRLGLKQAATGRWLEAARSFEAVEEASPGYRDAQARAAEIGRWQQTVPVDLKPKSELGRVEGGRYRLLGELGRGGMAVVYRAWDEALERDVALKFLSEEISGNPQMLKMFQREARSAAQLNHPNIVTVYDIGTLDGRAFICMEYVAGETVESMIEKQERIPVIEALRVIEHVLNALVYAHGRSIIHRDIKPSNMMRNELGVVKLMDFGLAKSTEAKAKTTIIAGTPSYMPPEQFTGKDVDAASDLFAVGASLYEMLAGRPPFDGMDRGTPPTPILEANPAVPRMLAKMIHKAIELDKARRYQGAAEMLQPVRFVLKTVEEFLRKQQADEGRAQDASNR